MSTYVVGDVQGCFASLMRLLEKIKFDNEHDELWFVGDLVNRGAQSLEVLRFVKSLKRKRVVLGNHDLHALAVYYSVRSALSTDHLDALLSASDRDELFSWLLCQPLAYFHLNWNVLMVHAGIPPFWSAVDACAFSQEVSSALRSDPKTVLRHLFSNTPDEWRDDLKGCDRMISIVNYFTRMRYLKKDDRLDFSCKLHPKDKTEGLTPWFERPRLDDVKIIFGHWASLNGETHREQFIGLDTGCIWGNRLTAYDVESGVRESVLAVYADR